MECWGRTALSLVMGGPQGWSERLRGGGRVAGTEWGRGGDGPPGAAPGRQAREGLSGEREGPAEVARLLPSALAGEASGASFQAPLSACR